MVSKNRFYSLPTLPELLKSAKTTGLYSENEAVSVAKPAPAPSSDFASAIPPTSKVESQSVASQIGNASPLPSISTTNSPNTILEWARRQALIEFYDVKTAVI